MKSIMLRLRNSFQWSVCALVLMLSVGEGFADLSIYDNVDLTNGDLEMPARLVPLPPEQTRIHEGMLDVTKAPYFADNTGTTDARAAIQNAMDDAYKANLVTFFPSGTYLCSDTLTGYQGWNQGFRGQQKFTYKLVGSTQGSRPVLKLMDNATLSYVGFGGDYPIFIHMTWRDLVDGVIEEHGERGYGLEFRGIDIDMGNNPNASALAMEGAQHSIIQDVHVYGTAFAYGIDGIPVVALRQT